MLVNCLIPVMRAGRVKTTGIGWQSRGDQLLIESDDRQNKDARNIPKRARHIAQARFMRIIMQDKLRFRVLVHPEGSSLVRSLARVRRFTNAERVSVRLAVTSAGLAIRIRSQPEAMEGIRLRIASRSSRFARFRWTAVPVVFPAVMPIFRCSFVSLARATNTTSGWA